VKHFSRKSISQKLAFVGVLLLATTAFAANKGPLQLYHPTKVGDKQLQAGSYTVQWEGSGDQVQLNVLQYNKTVATTAAHVVNTDTKSPYNEALVTANPDGSRSLAQIHFRGKKFALEVSGENGSASGAAGAGK